MGEIGMPGFPGPKGGKGDSGPPGPPGNAVQVGPGGSQVAQGMRVFNTHMVKEKLRHTIFLGY